MIKYLIQKEFLQIRRNAFLPKLIIMFPIVIMCVMPWVMQMEVKNIVVDVVDIDHTVESQRLVQQIAASNYFIFGGQKATYAEAMKDIEKGRADVIFEIRDGKYLIAANAVNGTKGSMGSAYLSQIVTSNVTHHTSNITPLTLYNKGQNYKLYMIPALMVMLLTLICGFLPALNVVSEKEVGTIEQINVTPVPKFVFILAKLLPYWLIGFLVLTVCFILAWLIYGIVPVGHFLLIYFFAVLFVLVMSGFGLVISNYSATMQQSMFVMWFCLLVVILMSGLFTPISSMPEWAQIITIFNPLKYFMEVMRMIYLKGSGFFDLLPQFGILLLFAVVFNSWAVISYRKNN